jgi:hypothetical protein
MFDFDKKFLFDGKSIRNEKGTVKEKNRAKGKGAEASPKDLFLEPNSHFQLI